MQSEELIYATLSYVVDAYVLIHTASFYVRPNYLVDERIRYRLSERYLPVFVFGILIWAF